MNVEKLMKHIVPFFIGRNDFGRYKMSSCSRGLCLIINNKINREGAEKDENALQALFEQLHFEVHVKQNLGEVAMEDAAIEFGKKDHSNFDAFVFIIMSHGGERDVIQGADGRNVKLEFLLRRFTSHRCQGLKGKPKLVIIQSCRGGREDPPSRCTDSSIPVSDSTLPKGIFPEEADFLLAFSTPPDYKAYRHPEFGSPFIQVCSIGRTGYSLFCRGISVTFGGKHKRR